MNAENPPPPHGFYPGQVQSMPQQHVGINQAAVPPQMSAAMPPQATATAPTAMMHQSLVNPGPAQIHSQISFHSESDIINDGLVDPIQKCKDLFNQLKQSLQLLLNQLPIVLNPSSDNKPTPHNQFHLLGKYMENFNRVCDLLVVNLRTASEAQQISTEIRNFSKLYANIGPMDMNRAENPQINSINIQMQRINEFRTMVQKYLGQHQAQPSQQHKQQQQQQQQQQAQPMNIN